MSVLVGLNRTTGAAMTGVEHLRQSIRDILTTSVGSRVMRPEYGSHLPRMVDLPVNKGWASAAQAEVARALGRWEPRITLSRITVLSVVDGSVTMTLAGQYRGDDVVLEITT